MYVYVVVKEKLYVTGSRHFYVIIGAVLSAPLIITTVIIVVTLVHRRRWRYWRKQALAKEALSAIDVDRQQSLVSKVLQQQQQQQHDDAQWELDPAMYVRYQHFLPVLCIASGAIDPG